MRPAAEESLPQSTEATRGLCRSPARRTDRETVLQLAIVDCIQRDLIAFAQPVRDFDTIYIHHSNLYLRSYQPAVRQPEHIVVLPLRVQRSMRNREDMS